MKISIHMTSGGTKIGSIETGHASRDKFKNIVRVLVSMFPTANFQHISLFDDFVLITGGFYLGL